MPIRATLCVQVLLLGACAASRAPDGGTVLGDAQDVVDAAGEVARSSAFAAQDLETPYMFGDAAGIRFAIATSDPVALCDRFREPSPADANQVLVVFTAIRPDVAVPVVGRYSLPTGEDRRQLRGLWYVYGSDGVPDPLAGGGNLASASLDIIDASPDAIVMRGWVVLDDGRVISLDDSASACFDVGIGPEFGT